MQPFTVAEPSALTVQAGPPATVTLAVPAAVILALLVAVKVTVEAPWAARVASLAVSAVASTTAGPRMVAVSAGAFPAS